MATIQKFEELEVWQLARQLSQRIYPLTFDDPIAKDFRFRDQLRELVDPLWTTLPKVLKEAVSLNL